MEKIKSYSRALDYLFTQLPMYQRQGKKAFKKDLGNIIALCERLDQPQNKFKSIHIAGTNGKGSVAHMIAAGLMSQGFKVGIYTSPHFKDFRERIKINGVLMDKEKVIAFVNKVLSINQKIKPSFFEITVAMAFQYFADEEVDYAVIETGLGGRLDSTNVVTPELSVITNISYDHTSFLGHSLSEIAGEKAGIIKPGVPVVIGEKQEEILEVFETKAKENKSKILLAQDLVHCKSGRWVLDGSIDLGRIQIKAAGPFFSRNLTTALAVLYVLNIKGLIVDWNKVKKFIKRFAEKTYYIGRWTLLSRQPDILVDSAHNEGGLKITLSEISKLNYKNLHFVLGFVNDKALDKILKLFPVGANYYYAKANIPRGMNAVTLKEMTSPYGLTGKAYSSIRRALAAARRKAGKEDLIYVGGSIFTVAEVL